MSLGKLVYTHIKSTIDDAKCMRGTGIANPSLAYPISLLVVIEVHDAQLLVFCVVLCCVLLLLSWFLIVVFVS
jgi:hypothetical protein